MEDRTLSELRAWCAEEPAVRAAILIGSRAEPARELDGLSDYDVVLFLSEGHGLDARDDWLSVFGDILIWLPETVEHLGRAVPTRLVQYSDGTRIDFSLSTAEILEAIRDAGRLPPWLDAGYRVLVDKGDVAAGLPEPEGVGYVPARPDEVRYRQLVTEFWWEAICIARSLARGEGLPARYSSECVLRFRCLVPMAEWFVQSGGEWRVPVRAVGRGLLSRLSEADRRALDREIVGSSSSESWDGLHAAMSTFRRMARAVGEDVGLAYPEELDAAVTEFIAALQGRDVST